MAHSSSAASAVLLITLSVCSLAHAQEPAAKADPEAPLGEQPAAAAPTAPDAPPAPPAPAPTAAPERLTLTTEYRAPQLRHHAHEGLYLRFGSGPGFVTLRGHGPSGGSASITDSGASGFITIGGAVAPGFVLAGTIQGTGFNSKFKGGPFADATVTTANGQTRTASRNAEGGFGMIGLLVDWYPEPARGFHAGLSSGLGVISLTNSAANSDLGGLNLGGSVFTGYDWSLGGKWALGLQLTVSGATTTKLKKDFDAPDSGYRLTPLSVGVQASVLYF